MIRQLKKKIAGDGDLKEILQGSLTTFLIRVIGLLLGYGVIILISKRYGASGVGVYSITLSWINFLAILSALGFNISVLRFVGQYKDKANEQVFKDLYKYILQLILPVSIFLGIGLYYSANYIAENILRNIDYIQSLKIGAVALPFFTINLVSVEYIRGLKLIKASEFIRSISRHFIVIIAVYLSVFTSGLLNAIFALVLGIISSCFLSVGYLLNFLKNKSGDSDSILFKKKELISISLPMMITTLSSFFLGNIGVFFLEIYRSSDQVGIFKVCQQLASVVSLVLIVVNTISGPKISELFWNQKREQLEKVVQQSTKIIFFISITVSICIILFSEYLLKIFGSEFLDGKIALIILVIGQIVNSIAGSVGIFLNMTGNQKVMRNIISVTTVIVTLSYILIVPKYGLIGAAAVSTIGAGILNISSVIYAYKKLSIITFYIPYLTDYK